MSTRKSKDKRGQLYRPDDERYLAEIDRVFFRDGYRLACDILGNELSMNSILYLTRKLYSEINDLTDSFTARCRMENRRVDCREKCSSCCHQAVLIIPYEAFFLNQYLSESLQEDHRRKIQARIMEKDRITRKMKVQEFLHYKYPCPFLEDECCAVYPARPMACRTYLSADLDSCVYEYQHPAEIDFFPGLYEFPLHAGRMINEGICTWLNEHKIHPTEWQLESSMATVMNIKGCSDKWLSGENIFQTRNYSDAEISYLHKFTWSYR
jgi:Fe-S-cluster containining protein